MLLHFRGGHFRPNRVCHLVSTDIQERRVVGTGGDGGSEDGRIDVRTTLVDAE